MLIGAVAGFVLFLWMWRKIDKPKPWVNQACKEIHTATLGMKITSVVCKLEIKINLSKSKVKLHHYSKSISTTKCVISPLFKINMHHQMWNCAFTPNRYAPPARTWTRDLQHVNWVWRPLHHQSLTLSSSRRRLWFYLDSSTHPDYPLISKVKYPLEFYERETFSWLSLFSMY